MPTDRRNPYLVLGVPYGTNRADATRAFAQRSRRAKRDDTFPYTVEDLTWALHQIEANLDDPTIAIDHFRVPADPAQLGTPDGPGLLRPAATPLPRRSGPTTPDMVEQLRKQAISEASSALLEQVTANGRAAYVPPEAVKPTRIQPETPIRRRPLVWPWIVAIVVLLALAGAVTAAILIGSGTDSTSAEQSTSEPDTPPPTSPDTPAEPAPDVDPDAPVALVDPPIVQIPTAPPQELQVTVLQPGYGDAAVAGDTVIVDYIGVRSVDGVEFDNSYDRFEPFPVVLGSGQVIAGWEAGLIGAQTGSRIQLDIPSELAYGAEARGDVIRANEALTFVIDVRAVIPPSDPADAPTDPGVPPSAGAAATTAVDLIEGEGAELLPGQTAVINYVLYRGEDLLPLESSWGTEPVPVPTVAGGFTGFVEGLPGMSVGGRRAIIIPPEDAFGPDGNPDLGLPAGSDMIVVVDLLGVYGTAES